MQFYKRTVWSLLLLLPAACLTQGPDRQPVEGDDAVDADAVIDILTGGSGGDSAGAANDGSFLNPVFPQTVPELEVEGGVDSDGRTIPAAEVSLRIDNRSGQAADVTVEFFIGDRIAHQSFLKMRSNTPPIVIGPELSTSIAASAMLADGSSAPNQRSFFEAEFTDPNTVLEYIIPAPAPPPPPPPDDEIVDPSEDTPPEDVEDDTTEEEEPPPPTGQPPAPPAPPAPQGCFEIPLNTLVAPGSPAPGAGLLELPDELDCYNFFADAGRRVFIGLNGAEVGSSDFCSDGNVFIECRRPSGAFLFGDRSFSDEGGDPGFFIMPETGFYTINVTGGFNTTGAYAFEVLDGDGLTQNFAVNINQPVGVDLPGPGAGNIESLASQDVFTFNAAPGQRVMFNGSIVSGGSLLWQCRDANNGFVFGPQFLANAGLRTLDLGGVYTVTVFPQGGVGGTYLFTALSNPTAPRDIAIDELIAPDVPMPGDGRFPQNAETDFYRITVGSPQTVYFDALPGGGGILWELRDPNGDTLFGPQFLDSFNDPGLIDLEIPGTYEIEMYTSSGFASNGYSFIVRTVPPPSVVAINIDDDPVSGNFQSPVDSFIYQFNADADQDVYFNTIDGGGCSINWRLETPSGGTLFNDCMDESFDPGTITLPETGIYSLHLRSDFFAGDYLFELVTPPQPEVFPITVGTTIPDSLLGAGTLEAPGAMDIYTLTVASGETFFLNVTFGANDSYWTMDDGFSTFFDTEFLFTGSGLGPFTVPPGDYFITVFNFNGNVDNYGFEVLNVPQPVSCPITVDTLVSLDVPCQGQSGQISPAFDRDVYTFSTSMADTMLYFDVVGLNGNLAWTLRSPAGGPVFDTFTMNFDPGVLTLSQAGPYTIEVFSRFGGTGVYSFQITTPAPPTMCAIGLDQFVTLNTPCAGVGHINSATDRDIMTFNAPVPDGQVVFDVSILNFNTRWSVRETNGPFVFQQFSMNFDPGPRTLVPGAEYTIVVESNNGGIGGNYAFTVVDVPAAQQFAIGYEQAVGPNVPAAGAGNITAVGETDVYTFNGMAGDVVYFDVLQANFGLRWQLDDPQGFRMFGPFSLGFDAGRFALPVNGTYVITVSAPVGNSGDYGFVVHLCPMSPDAGASHEP
ncbi:MAG: hypothetical protein HOP29_16650 [Phycisphaerales bacterium]|nr:hypothetical protein [Phycisphaerales bacterium]